MKKIMTIVAMLLSFNAYTQRSIASTDEFLISGQVLHEIEFNIKDIDSFKIVKIPDMIIRNHKGEVKDTATNLEGFLLKDLLDMLEYPVEKPRELNEFYFTFFASDGYKVVFSWNEIYNTEIGNSLYVVTKMGEKNIDQMEQRILIVSAGDLRVGPRYNKAVKKIIVSRTK